LPKVQAEIKKLEKDADKLDAKARARLRQRALDWLQADLAAWTRLVEEGPPSRALAQKALAYWRNDADLAGVREPDQLAALSEAERDAWRALWAEVAQTLRRARDLIPATEKGKEKAS
jgi:hypothetical protein